MAQKKSQTKSDVKTELNKEAAATQSDIEKALTEENEKLIVEVERLT